MTSRTILFLTLVVTVLQSCKDKSERVSENKVVPYKLPMQAIDLKDLKTFKSPGKNWQLASKVSSDFQKEHDVQPTSGNGVIVNVQDGSDSTHLFTDFDHGDLELELDFMIPKGSNSGVYFQGRYEVQLFDSWNVKDPKYSDCGAIYQRWDETKPQGQQGYEGHAPKVNACKAPGLWQHLKVYFRAPRFDANGNKIANARFEHVYLNDFLIHENVEVSGPTRAAFYSDEKPTGPLMMQGDHGPVAFRNIKYKSYTLDSLSLQNIAYDVYDGIFNRLPDFSTLKPTKSGTSTVLNVGEAAGKNEMYAIIYRGDLIVPVNGEYLFTVNVDEGGEMFIDGKSILKQDVDPGGGTVRALVSLTEGNHKFEFNYYQFTWNSGIEIFYEGPGISRKELAPGFLRWEGAPKEPIIINIVSTPEMIRSFIIYNDTVKTHVISIGDPMGVHYTFDLERGALIKAWKGIFADAFGMWHDRGESQLLEPGNFSISISDQQSTGRSFNPDEWSKDAMHFVFKRYTLDKTGHPAFIYQKGDILVEDQLLPTADSTGLTRTLKFNTSSEPGDIFYLLASGKQIEKLSNGYYHIDGNYYLKVDQAEGVELQAGTALIAPILKDKAYI